MTPGGCSLPFDPDFVDAVARRVVDMLHEEGQVPSDRPRFVTVAQVSQEFGLSTAWLYANASALGAIRLGSGPRARLRFDRTTIGVQIARLASRRSRSLRAEKKGRGKFSDHHVDLLPILDTAS